MMEKKIIFATGNMGKLDEIRQILTGYEIVSMKEAGASIDIEENGQTFEENALIKARAVHAVTGGLVMADDSGLEVDALNKEPGVYSARYLGEDTPYDIKNAKILERLKDVPDEKRTARFVCAIAAVCPDGSELVVRGVMEGVIAHEIAGMRGFGYDPIFMVPEFGMTNAELTNEQKNEASHRGKALRAMRDLLLEQA